MFKMQTSGIMKIVVSMSTQSYQLLHVYIHVVSVIQNNILRCNNTVYRFMLYGKLTSQDICVLLILTVVLHDLLNAAKAYEKLKAGTFTKYQQSDQ